MIERGRLSPTTAEIVRSTGLSRTAVDAALAAMEGYRMIERRHGHWTITAGTGLTDLARRLGALDDAAEQISRHRRQRAAWHAWLDRHETTVFTGNDFYDAEQDDYWLPPPDGEMGTHGFVWQAA